MHTNTNRTRARWGRVLVALAMGIGTTLVGAGSADATIFERFEYDGTDEVQFPICDILVDSTVEFSGHGHIRQGKNKQAGAFFFHDNFSVLETITNPANGKFFTISGNGIFKEIKATPRGDDVFEFVDIEAGQPFVVRDMDGNVVVRDRGLISFTYLFDTGGDDVPGGTFLELLDVRVAGPHPAFFTEEGGECPTVLDLIG